MTSTKSNLDDKVDRKEPSEEEIKLLREIGDDSIPGKNLIEPADEPPAVSKVKKNRQKHCQTS